MKTSLSEYRCHCGKLLFKGTIILSTIEVKCKRCGSTETFNYKEHTAPISLTVTLDGGGIIIDACRAVLYFGWERQALIGKHFSTLFPFSKDTSEVKHLVAGVRGKQKREFEIRNNTLLLRDGGTIPAESYLSSRAGDDVSAEKYILTALFHF